MRIHTLNVSSVCQGLRYGDNSTFVAVLVIVDALIWAFLLCCPANLATDTVSSIGNIAYNGNWTLYPPVYRKYVLLIILRSQSTAEFMGYKLIRCNLETFSNVSSDIFFI